MYAIQYLILSFPYFLSASSQNTRASKGPSKASVEWTALGDSYAVGTGTGLDLGWGRCLRFSSAYPEILLHDADTSALGASADRVLNFPACSGATSADISAHQFGDLAAWDLQYGQRPAFGDPTFATLTAGGDDVDFVNLVRNCVYDILPWRSCDEQRKASWAMLKAPELVDDLDNVIRTTVSHGRSGSAGNDFQLFVTSYARFFNAETPQCSNVTWSILPEPFGNRQKLTHDLRRDLNDMTEFLNGAIQTAVARNNASNVHYINWDTTTLDGHRYCEAQNIEPCDRNRCPGTWFWEYPNDSEYGSNNEHEIGPFREDEETFKDHLAKLWDDVEDFRDLVVKGPDGRLPDVPQGLQEAHKWIEGLQNLTEMRTGSKDEHGVKFPPWLIERVRVFHPTEEAHRHIAGLILEELKKQQVVLREKGGEVVKHEL